MAPQPDNCLLPQYCAALTNALRLSDEVPVTLLQLVVGVTMCMSDWVSSVTFALRLSESASCASGAASAQKADNTAINIATVTARSLLQLSLSDNSPVDSFCAHRKDSNLKTSTENITESACSCRKVNMDSQAVVKRGINDW